MFCQLKTHIIWYKFSTLSFPKYSKKDLPNFFFQLIGILFLQENYSKLMLYERTLFSNF